MEFLKTRFGKLAYKKYGKGDNYHLLFHGFGQSTKAYDVYLPLREEGDCFLVFDIFFHGQSSWISNTASLTKEAWAEIVVQLMDKEKMKTFHLIGYSMGGKFCLVTYELFPKAVKSLLLMAPDGIKTGFWYNMASFPIFFNRLFKHVVFHPERFFKTIDILHNLGLLQSSFVKFVKSQMHTRTKRAQAYYTWNVFKPLHPNLSLITKLLNETQTPISLITGEFDKMVTAENLKEFSSQISHIKSISLPSGHNDLISETSRYISLQEIAE